MNVPDDDQLLDRALCAVRDDMPNAATEAAALNRVRHVLDQAPGVIDDFHALVPDYVAGALSPARRLLFEEELRTSIPLRRAVSAADRAAETSLPGTRRDRPAIRERWPWAAAAAVVGVVLLLNLPLDDQARLARVEPAAGTLYRVGVAGLEALAAGDWVAGDVPLRTGKSGAVRLALEDGSAVELKARTQLQLRRQSGGNRVQVDRGHIIVQAASQGDGRLEVATEDVLVAVKGTVFGVSHGVAGTRVAVVEGEVEVHRGDDRTSLAAGEQFASDGAAPASVADEVAWSDDAERYAAMLAEYAALKRELGSLLETEPRHSGRLLGLVPDDAVGYVAIPNAPAMIADGYAVLRKHFVEAPADERVEDALAVLGEVADHLGEEAVLVVREADAPPIALAEIVRDGLRPLLETRVPELLATLDLSGDEGIEVIASLDEAQAREGRLLVWLADDVLVASTDVAALDSVAVLMDAGATQRFAGRKLHAHLAERYRRGTSYLAGFDLTRLGARPATHVQPTAGLDLAGAETLVAEGFVEGERTRLTVDVRFADAVPPALTWLDEPGPMGALDFFGPDADIAAAVVLGRTGELAKSFEGSHATQRLKDAELHDVAVDLLGAVGGELAFGFDGPLLPSPSWRAVVEVYDQGAFQRGVEKAVERINARAGEGLRVALNVNAAAAYPIYHLDFGLPLFAAYYAYLEGYLVAAASPALIEQARRTHASGVTLTKSARFRELLPNAAPLDFSAVGFSEFGELAGSVRRLLRDAAPEEQKAVLDMLAEAGPWLYAATRESDRIRLTVNGPLGLSLPELAILAGMGTRDDGA